MSIGNAHRYLEPPEELLTNFRFVCVLEGFEPIYSGPWDSSETMKSAFLSKTFPTPLQNEISSH
jgi:hypothetical protein